MGGWGVGGWVGRGEGRQGGIWEERVGGWVGGWVSYLNGCEPNVRDLVVGGLEDEREDGLEEGRRGRILDC